ncbi:MAG: ATP-binding protein [Deltaproteobacteria bacterium]|nr:ATP-binding protein [Deltaproteobacteria bacterium]
MTNTDDQDIPEIGIDIADFSVLRNEGYVYVDKTGFVHEILVGPRRRLFLSRPRRFGKTLLIDTLEQAAAGRKELFSGLAIDRMRGDAEWPRSHVLRISMNAFGDDPSSLDQSLATYLQLFAEDRGFTIKEENSALSLFQTIRTIYRNYADIPIVTQSVQDEDWLVADRRKIIVLIDEYDAPIVNNLTDPASLEVAKKTLHGFYNALKSCENMIDRVFITGITKFPQLSVFSAMNNLRDITFQSNFSTICGFTCTEITKYYSPHLDSTLAEFRDVKKFGPNFTCKLLMERITDHYDGYSWNGEDQVLNPLSLQNFLVDKVFDNYWIRSGAMNFLNQMNIRDDIFSKVFKGQPQFNGNVDIQDAGNADPVALMLQAGYLTVRKKQVSDKVSQLYLAVPNKEVSMAIVKNFVETRVIPHISMNNDNFTLERCREFCSVFCNGQLSRAEELLQSFLTVIPYSLHLEMESFYHVFLLTIFKMCDFTTLPEREIAQGIIDLVISSPEHGFRVTEMKYSKSDNTSTDRPVVSDSPPGTVITGKDNRKLDSCIKAAFKQIIKNEYLLPFADNPNPVHAVAVAVCGRNHVRIKSLPAEELLKRSHEFLTFEEDQED